jgi:hypothetical protein
LPRPWILAFRGNDTNLDAIPSERVTPAKPQRSGARAQWEWFKRFNGVATKNLRNALGWLQALEA